MLDDTDYREPELVTQRFHDHLGMLERLAMEQGMELVAHLLGCARMAMEPEETIDLPAEAVSGVH